MYLLRLVDQDSMFISTRFPIERVHVYTQMWVRQYHFVGSPQVYPARITRSSKSSNTAIVIVPRNGEHYYEANRVFY